MCFILNSITDISQNSLIITKSDNLIHLFSKPIARIVYKSTYASWIMPVLLGSIYTPTFRLTISALANIGIFAGMGYHASALGSTYTIAYYLTQFTPQVTYPAD